METPTIAALIHLRALMAFFDDWIKPKINYINNQCEQIWFNELWHLFKPGDEVLDQQEKQAYCIVCV